MRLLYFSRDYTTHDHRFLTALSQTSHQVYYLRLEGGRKVLEDRTLPAGIEIVEWAGGKQPAKLKDGLHLLNDLKRVIRQVNPELVHAGPVQRSAFLVALAGFHPLVSMSWGYDLLHDANLNAAWRWVTEYTLRRSDAFVGDCDTIRNLAQAFGMRNERIVTFPWGIDLARFSIEPLEQSDINTSDNYIRTVQGANVQKFTVLSTRSWEPMYGIDVIARAFSIAARKRPELRLTLLGGGSQYAPVRQILLVGSAFDMVNFPGQVSYSQLPGYFQQADLYVSASHSDGTSISLLEAFATGTPAIVPDIPGNREWVTQGENGWLFTDGDAEALASTMVYAVDHRQDLIEMGRRARALAEQRADWQKNFAMLEKAYELALS
jgi:glycosyltransferase involved in cell wall biosynthesis